MKTTTLDGIWSLSPLDTGATLPYTRFFHRQPSILCALPGDIHSALLDAGIISDPYWGTDELHMQWVGTCGWRVARDFSIVPEDLKGCRAMLTLTMVDTMVEVVVNGKAIGTCSNQFRRWRFDCTEALVAGTNTIELLFTSAEKAALAASYKLPYPIPYSEYPVSSPHRNLIRKSQCHSGWDWGPCLLAMGVYESLNLEFVELGQVDSVVTATTRIETGWHVHIDIDFLAHKKGALEISATVADGAATKTVSVTKGSNHWSLDMNVKEVEPWMPVGYGNPHLYPLVVQIGGLAIERKLGFRTVEIVTNDGAAGPGGMTFSVNGRRIFCKGANWIPLDAFPSRQQPQRYKQLLQDAVEANMNMVRVWGGGMYEHDCFYTTCDEKGLLVWQDCMFSCAMYPATEEFLSNVEAELRYQIPRLQDHPSIVLWCGNNEDYGAIGWYEQSRAHRDRYVVDYDRLNEGTVGRIVRELDPNRPWWPSSPSAGPGKFSDNWHDDAQGDMHYWSVWHEGKPFESYYDVVPRFASEFGYQSFPSVSGVSEYAPEEQWNLTSVVMEHHQKNPRGNTIILENFTRYFRFPNGFANMLYLSQVQQALAMKMAIEYWRTQRPRCMGTLYWQLNDNWPVASWSSIEYSGKWKLLHYAAKRFYAPILPILYKKDGEVHVHVVNDTDTALDCRISVKIRRFDGTKLSQQVFLPHVQGESDCPVTSYSLNSLAVQPQEAYMHVKLSTKDLFIENSLFLAEPKRCVLHDPDIGVEVGKTHDGFVVTLACRAPAFAVALDAGKIRGVFNDNMFDLRPTASRTVRFKTKEECPVETFVKNLTITDLYSSSR